MKELLDRAIEVFLSKYHAQVVKKVDSTLHRINHFALNSAADFLIRTQWRPLAFERPQPVLHSRKVIAYLVK